MVFMFSSDWQVCGLYSCWRETALTNWYTVLEAGSPESGRATLTAGGQERLTLVPSSLGGCLVFLGSAGRARLASSLCWASHPSPCFPYTSSASVMKGRTLTGFIASCLRILICKDPFFQTRSHFSVPADQGVDFSHGPSFTLLWTPLPSCQHRGCLSCL